jgi:hypothetical protein
LRPEQPPNAWAIIKESALRRLGRPLLIWYAVLLGIGAVVVLSSLLVVRFGR